MQAANGDKSEWIQLETNVVKEVHGTEKCRILILREKFIVLNLL